MVETLETLVSYLSGKGYNISHLKIKPRKESSEPYKIALISGYNIRGAISNDLSGHVYDCIANTVAADHVDSFSTWKNCPLKARLPLDERKLLKALKFLGTDRGVDFCEKSGGYDYDFG